MSENIDDLFRQELEGHATPPGDALWARLQAHTSPGAAPPPADDEVDARYQKTLARHATPPPRHLWERLEDEHLRPRRRRAAAWWPMALAAAVALLLVAGGAGLWLRSSLKATQSGLATAAPKGTAPQGTSQRREPKPAAATTKAQVAVAAAPNQTTRTANPYNKAAVGRGFEKNRAPQATRFADQASTAPKALAAATQPVHARKGVDQRPDAAADRRRLVARTAPRPTLQQPRPAAPDEVRPRPEPAPAVALAPQPTTAPAAAAQAAGPAASLANAGELITVDVRNGAAPVARSPKSIITALAAAGAPAERRRLGGRLLQQAAHLVRGERLSLTEVTGLPRNVTLQATVAGHRLTKSIQL